MGSLIVGVRTEQAVGRFLRPPEMCAHGAASLCQLAALSHVAWVRPQNRGSLQAQRQLAQLGPEDTHSFCQSVYDWDFRSQPFHALWDTVSIGSGCLPILLMMPEDGSLHATVRFAPKNAHPQVKHARGDRNHTWEVVLL